MSTLQDYQTALDAKIVALGSTRLLSDHIDEYDRLVRGQIHHQLRVAHGGIDDEFTTNVSYELVQTTILLHRFLSLLEAEAGGAYSGTEDLADAVKSIADPDFFESMTEVYNIVSGGEIDAGGITREGDVLTQEISVTVSLTP